MFRPMRRASRAIPEEAAKHLLQQSRRGVLAVNGDNGYPFAIPVNYYYDQEHDKIYFHGAKSGQKVDALKQNDKVCFTVYGNEHFEPGDWAPYVQSTVVFGRCHLIDDAAGELLAEDLRQAQNALSEITGEFTPDDLLGRIFSSFCIGK